MSNKRRIASSQCGGSVEVAGCENKQMVKRGLTPAPFRSLKRTEIHCVSPVQGCGQPQPRLAFAQSRDARPTATTAWQQHGPNGGRRSVHTLRPACGQTRSKSSQRRPNVGQNRSESARLWPKSAFSFYAAAGVSNTGRQRQATHELSPAAALCKPPSHVRMVNKNAPHYANPSFHTRGCASAHDLTRANVALT